MLDHTYKRTLDFSLLCTDSSVTHHSTIDLSDWSYIRDCYKAIPNMPLPETSKLYLKNHLFSDSSLVLLEVRSPKVVLFRFPNGEVRSFVATQGGFLLESPENYLWDSAFPFIKSSGDSVAFELPQNLPVVSNQSSLFFANHSSNFTHFLLDFWALLAGVLSRGQRKQAIPNEIPIFESPISWQNEYFDLIGPFIPLYCHDFFQRANSSWIVFAPSSIVFPVFENKPLSLLWARKYMHQLFSQKAHQPVVKPLDGRIVFLTRNDSRRDRIRNISDIENLVISMGGHVVDPVQFSVAQRLQLFSLPCVFIAESSGSMNFSLFAHRLSRLIFLVDQSGLESVDLLVGGWIYGLGYASSSDFVCGSGWRALPGSPLGSAEFSLTKIRDLINYNIRAIASKL